MQKQLNVRGQATRKATLNRAVQLASTYGLEGITIGMLSKELNMSKSGLIGLFGTKEVLQIAVLHRAVELFHEAVIEPTQLLPYGTARFNLLIESWICYLEKDVFEGGCFFTSTASEFDSRPGVVRDELVRAVSLGIDYLENEAKVCLNGDNRYDESKMHIFVFEIHSLLLGVNLRNKLFQDKSVFKQVRLAVAERLQFFVN
jgi:AcrR family transcriptional regulator